MRVIVAPATRPEATAAWNHRRVGLRRRLGILTTLVVLAAVFGAATGYFVREDMPDLRGLEDHAPSEMTRILARDGSDAASFATERRILLDVDDIPRSFRLALIASEDQRFEDHPGVDLLGGLRALWADVRHRRLAQGASTLTMQLAGNLFLDRSERTLRRKLQEVVLAMAIEHRFSKQEILRMYANQVYFGHGLYGLEAAARFYFGKPARSLSVGESATLVGLLPLPARYSPVRDRERAVKRRNLVMRRMVAEGYLDASLVERLVTEPIVLARHDSRRETGPHFNEAVRRRLQEDYGTSALYGGGLVVKTTLDRRLQRIAEDAIRTGLRSLDKRQGWRPDAVRRVPGGEDPKNWAAPAWAAGIADGRVTDGIVLEVDVERAVVRVGERTGTLAAGAIGWTGKQRPDRLLRSGDVIRVRVLASHGPDGIELALEQEPAAEAALVTLDPTTGEVLALVGGYDFTRSEYDRVTQARRQAGSLFKPFVYAAALERGWTLADTLVDAPTVFLDRRKPVPYQPENFSRRYDGAITLRRALEQSINIAAVRLLERVGPDSVIHTARRLGVESTLRPYPSLALGAFELSLLEVTSAYGALANRGLHLEPHWIEEVRDRKGRTIHRSRPRVREAVSPQVAYLMNQALLGVVRHGTGRRAGQLLDHTLAGKTGTTDDNTDAWFVGYSPQLVVGVWVGHDEPKSLGRHETGARAALPIWIDFMRQALTGLPDVPFAVPEGVATSPIDPDTGLRPRLGAGCGDYIVESFIEGSEPSRLCSAALHERLRFPHSFQHHPLDADGALQVPRDALARLLAQERDVVFDIESKTLVAFGRDGAARLAVDELPEQGLPDRDALPFEAGDRTGTDGRPVTPIWFEPEPRRASRH